MSRLLLLNKPYGVLSQFTSEPPHRTLAEFIEHKGFYAAGRLDKDSEGLLLLTDDGKLQQKISNPKYGKFKTYLVQVEGEPTDETLEALRRGIELKDGPTKPAEARCIPEPQLWDRDPPIRERKSIPTSWIELSISEGRNRQVRRMTAAIGYPTLRLIRTKIDQWELGALQPGQSRLLQL
ncbi:MAG: pseudouridine synthase [Pseudohongiella sp.]|nr:MAG: pseudouridine synthase [Pseudohongiella sp.]